MGHQRRVIAVDGAWGVEQNRQQVFFDVPYFRGVFADTVKDKLNVRTVQLHQLGFHQLGGVIVPGNADGLSGAAYGFHQQVHNLVQHIPVNPLGVLAKVFILDVVLDDLPINLYGALWFRSRSFPFRRRSRFFPQRRGRGKDRNGIGI